ncbi:hypothetical protein K491DRAFT_695774 [Lophiostoma macrostomum CBS 122681]|uniref:Altered inheritance of mitochondria protein 6 n=1 Tax=Lophiostoma macrostomum CBS 122681 TaxID=1314788 RepID=A0A6A6SWZ3_9PLEO|nr:hypothetical protein K491DRAFT_695774 [Lophiostoma macrostomum CBS 122681]
MSSGMAHAEASSANLRLARSRHSELDIPLQDASIVSLRSLEDDAGVGDSQSIDGGLWRKVLRTLRLGKREREPLPGHRRLRAEEDEIDNGGVERKSWTGWEGRRFWRRRRWAGTMCCVFVVVVLSFFGVVHLLNVIAHSYPLLWDDPEPLFSSRPAKARPNADLSAIPADLTKGVVPVPCHSHNDYWRKVPLYEALYYGCTGVEADVWLFDDELFVGHDTRSLTKNRTLRSMYVDPIVTMLDQRNNGTNRAVPVPDSTDTKNGIWETDPLQSLILLVDFKNDGEKIYPFVVEQLSALRDRGYLTYCDGESKTVVSGAVTVVGTGNAPYDLITANETYRDIFFDAPLASLYEDPGQSTFHPASEIAVETTRSAQLSDRALGQGTVGTNSSSTFDSSNSYYASVSFAKSIGWVWFGRLTPAQKKLIRGQLLGAKKRGLKSRYWGTPDWPKGVRNYVWKVLVEMGVDVLNGDDLEGMTRGDWWVGGHQGWT